MGGGQAPVSLDGVRMATASTSAIGVVDAETILVFEQAGDLFSARYRGGSIWDGLLVGRMLGEDRVEFRYVQLDRSGAMDQGVSTGTLTRLADGRLQLVERFEWLTRVGGGENVFEEITPL